MPPMGLLAMELYTPAFYVSQADMEVFQNVGAGKYTAGLGQDEIGFCGADEDAVSMALTALHRLMEKVGFLTQFPDLMIVAIDVPIYSAVPWSCCKDGFIP